MKNCNQCKNLVLVATIKGNNKYVVAAQPDKEELFLTLSDPSLFGPTPVMQIDNFHIVLSNNPKRKAIIDNVFEINSKMITHRAEIVAAEKIYERTGWFTSFHNAPELETARKQGKVITLPSEGMKVTVKEVLVTLIFLLGLASWPFMTTRPECYACHSPVHPVYGKLYTGNRTHTYPEYRHVMARFQECEALEVGHPQFPIYWDRQAVRCEISPKTLNQHLVKITKPLDTSQ